MSDTPAPTPAPALTDEQIDVNLKIIRDCAASLTRAVSAPGLIDRTVAAVIARAKREAAEEIAQAIDRLHDTVYQARHVPELDPLRVDTACEAYRDGAAIARRIGATR